MLAQRDITGVTFSGGEPLQQAPALLSVIEILHGRNPHLSFRLYTGYTATVTTRDRFGLVLPDGYGLDIRFRML